MALAQTFLAGYAAAGSGEVWVPQTTPRDTTVAGTTEPRWTSVAYGKEMYVAIAQQHSKKGNMVMTSPDAETWTIVDTGTDDAGNNINWYSVNFGGGANGLFMACGQACGGCFEDIMTSPDGAVWTKQDINMANGGSPRSMVYAFGVYIVVGDKFAATSTDGITYTQQLKHQTSDISLSRDGIANTALEVFLDVAYDGSSLVIAVGQGGEKFISSVDGITWNGIAGTEFGPWYEAITYGNGLWVAVGRGGGADDIATSPDGVTWTIQSYPVVSSWYGVAWGDGNFVATSGGGTPKIMSSSDGITWTDRSPSLYGNDRDKIEWFDVIWGGGRFVMIGSYHLVDAWTHQCLTSAPPPLTATSMVPSTSVALATPASIVFTQTLATALTSAATDTITITLSAAAAVFTANSTPTCALVGATGSPAATAAVDATGKIITLTVTSNVAAEVITITCNSNLAANGANTATVTGTVQTTKDTAPQAYADGGYAFVTSNPTSAPTRTPSGAPTTPAPSTAPSIAPTSAPTTSAPTSAPTTTVPSTSPNGHTNIRAHLGAEHNDPNDGSNDGPNDRGQC